LSIPIVKPKPKQTTTTTKTTTTKPSQGGSQGGGSTSTTTSSSSSSKIVKKWTYNANINNGFYRGYCTWYVATQVPSIFAYTSDSTQDRPFG
jgi:hypothetical protein